MKTIHIATDHAGFEYKEALKEHLTKKGFICKDYGAIQYDDKDDYPDFVVPLAKHISTSGGIGIIFGGSGQGEAIAANRFNGVRAVVYQAENLNSITVARDHNDANVLSVGVRFISKQHMIQAVELFLQTPFSNNQRHIRRIEKIDYGT